VRSRSYAANVSQAYAADQIEVTAILARPTSITALYSVIPSEAEGWKGTDSSGSTRTPKRFDRTGSNTAGAKTN